MTGARVACLDEETALAFVRPGTLSAAAHAMAEHHLDGCAACRLMVAEAARLAHGASADRPASDPPRASATSLLPGMSVARYTIARTIGSGRGGVVYRAYDTELKRPVALKLLTAREAQARLLREAQAMASLAHPNVVQVFDVGTFEGRVFLVMELVEGETLTDWLCRRQRPWHEVLGVFLSAGRGLGAAHASGIVHRDFKPDNVLIGKNGSVRVTDFGLARPLGDVASAATGTPAFMAPEQFGPGPIDARADQFSFCVALSWALRGRHPSALAEASFARRSQSAGGPGNPPRVPTWFDAGQPGPRPSLGRIPSWLDQTLARGLGTSPAARFPSMDALLGAMTPGSRRHARAALAVASVLIAAGVGLGLSMNRADVRDAAALRTCDARGTGGVKPSEIGDEPPCFESFAAPLDWRLAVSACEARGAALPTCESHVSCDRLAEAARGREQTWIGLSDVLRPGVFAWVTGVVTPTYLLDERWRTGEPRARAAAPRCVALAEPGGTASGRPDRHAWLAGDCAERHPYLCAHPPWYVSIKTHHRYRLLPVPMAWDDAVAGCRRISAHLATVDDDGEQAFLEKYFIISNHFTPGSDLWLGGADRAQQGHFRWITGEPFEYRAFASGQPDNADGRQRCLILNGVSRRWHDRQCELAYQPLCEAEPDP